MKFLFLLNPRASAIRKLRNEMLLSAARLAASYDGPGGPVEIKVCAPHVELRKHAQETLGEAEAIVLPPSEAEDRYAEALAALEGRSTEAGERRSAYLRAEGPAAEALGQLVSHIRSHVFQFDAIVSPVPARPLERAAAEVDALSIRAEVWPGIWGRWLYFNILRFRTPRGIDPLEQLEIADLQDIGLKGVPASVDQRLYGVQAQVNPFESKFAPLGDELSRAFRPGCRTALILPQSASDTLTAGGNAFPGAGSFIDAVLPPLLDAGWRCLVLGETASGRRLAGKRAECEGVFLIDEAVEFQLKEGRRKILALLAQSDLVVTDNSPSALEAMIFERPVCVLGRPFYALRGAFPSLKTMLSGGFDEEAYREGGALIRAFFFRAYAAPFMGPDAAHDLLARILTIAELTRRFEDDPCQWARNIQEKFGNAKEATWLEEMRETHARVEQFMED